MKNEKVSDIVSAVALFVVGMALAIYADEVLDWISVILGALAIAYATITLISYLSTKPKERRESSIFMIVLAAAAGIVMISKSTFIREMISFVVGVYIIITSALQLSTILDFKRLTGAKIRSLILPILGIFVGGLCISGDILVPDSLARITGIFLALYAVIYLTGLFMFRAEEKKVKTNYPKIQEGEIVEEAKSEKKSTKK